jgi:hypothetical protein
MAVQPSFNIQKYIAMIAIITSNTEIHDRNGVYPHTSSKLKYLLHNRTNSKRIKRSTEAPQACVYD